MAKSTIEHQLNDEDVRALIAQLKNINFDTFSRANSLTIIEIGPCWVKLEDGMLKAGCDT